MPFALMAFQVIAYLIENEPKIEASVRSAVGAIRDAFSSGRDPSPEEMAAFCDAAIKRGVSFRLVISLRLAPGGDWHGRADIPADVLAAFEAATDRRPA